MSASGVESRCLIRLINEFEVIISYTYTGQVGLGVGSRSSNRATEGSNPKGSRLYFVILLKNVDLRGILQSRSHNFFIGSHECLLLFTPSCCGECFYDL